MRGMKMGRVIQSPMSGLSGATAAANTKLFLAGTITGTVDWQDIAAREIADRSALTVFNPRQADWGPEAPRGDIEAQIRWEYESLRRSGAVAFWFAKETVAPIALYELGRATERGQKLFVGADLAYLRRLDIETQLLLVYAPLPTPLWSGVVHATVKGLVNEVLSVYGR